LPIEHAFKNFWSTGEMKRLVFAFLTLAVLAGCNTMEGLGRDVEKLGNTIEDAARKSR
jgi:predicted small secreted protein